jgi:hypothetical protein
MGLRLLFICSCVVAFAETTFARPPENQAERALLYWRYLCRGGTQIEKLEGHRREFRCVSQSWSVIGPSDQGRIEEIHRNDR